MINTLKGIGLKVAAISIGLSLIGLGLLSLACVGLPDLLMPRLRSMGLGYGDVLVETTSSNEVKQKDSQGKDTANRIELRFRLTKPLSSNRTVSIAVELTNDYLKKQTTYSINVYGQSNIPTSVSDIEAYIRLQEVAIDLVDDYAEFEYVR